MSDTAHAARRVVVIALTTLLALDWRVLWSGSRRPIDSGR